jgi:sigma-B regulation protein RsbU (phosphoserine phosphatase)
MEQQQFNLKRSLSSKMVISVILLIGFILISFGLLSTSIVKKDKIFQTQQILSNEAELLGNTAVDRFRKVTDSLRIYLGAFDPNEGIKSDQNEHLQAIADNQSSALVLRSYVVDLNELKKNEAGSKDESAQTQALRLLTAHQAAELISKNRLSLDEVALEPSEVRAHWKEIEKYGVAFLNRSRLGYQPIVGVLFADLKNPLKNGNILLGYSEVIFEKSDQQRRSSMMILVNELGDVLFSNDLQSVYQRANLLTDPLLQFSNKSLAQNLTQEFNDSGSRWLGGFSKVQYGLTVLSKTSWIKAMSSTYRLVEQLVMIGLAMICFAVIGAIVFSHRLVRPILKLSQATEQVASGDFNLKLKTESQDEVGQLTSSFGIMSQKINELIKENVQKAKIESELKVAAAVQEQLLPAERVEEDHYKLTAHYHSATECGGDWWCYFKIKNKLCLVIADATGHGVSSALMTASAKSCVSMIENLIDQGALLNCSSAQILSFLNQSIYDSSRGQVLMTAFAAVIDFETKVIQYANAGHNPPWLFVKNKIHSLTGQGVRLGESKYLEKNYENKTIEFTNQTRFFLYTDGLLEGSDLEGKLINKKQIRSILIDNLEKSPEYTKEKLIELYQKHQNGKELDDDVTFVIADLLMGEAV